MLKARSIKPDLAFAFIHGLTCNHRPQHGRVGIGRQKWSIPKHVDFARVTTLTHCAGAKAAEARESSLEASKIVRSHLG